MAVTLENGIRIEASDGEHYRIMQFLGSGGNGEVYLAISTKGKWQGIVLAVKFVFKIEDKERLAQFEKEKKFLTTISHPSIMKIYAEGSYYATSLDKSIPFVVCDYFLDRLDWKIRNKKLRHTEKLIYITQLLSALDFLEKTSPQIAHRDIKPQNIFIKGYTCVLGDFGLMKDLSEISSSEEGDFFKKSKGAGMPRSYRTPDLVKYAKNKVALTTASDVFQLGLVSS